MVPRIGIEPLPERAISKASRSVDRGSSDCFHGSRFFNLGRQLFYPPMRDGKAVSLAILMADAFGGPATNCIDDVGRAFDGTETVT